MGSAGPRGRPVTPQAVVGAPAGARRAAAGWLVAGLVTTVLSGCDGPVQDEWVPLGEALETRGLVRDRTTEIAAVLTDQGLAPFGAGGSWTSCTDDEYAFMYVGSARLDAKGPSGEGFGELVDAVVDATGWQTDGPGALDSSTLARGPLGEVDVRLTGYDDGPELLINVYGECLPIAPEDREDLDQGDPGDQEIDIGAFR